LEAATFHDVDALAVTGLTHHPVLTAAAALFTDSFRPALLDPEIGNRGYDPGYFTTLPDTRYAKFDAPAQVDPNVVAVDEATKDVFATTEAPDALGIGMLSPYSALITAPVLVAVGSRDPLFCGLLATNCTSAATIVSAERPYYASSPCVSAYVLPGSGHSLNLNPSTAAYQRGVLDWANGTVRSTNPPPPSRAC
jgi:pimeloyl-ACP methyl ester carboxylesterase